MSAALTLMDDAPNELLFRAASPWELAIKRGLGRVECRVEPRVFRRGLLDNGDGEIPVTSAHTVALDALSPLHRNPFDGLLLARAVTEGVTLLISDPDVAGYPAPVRLA